MAEPGRRRGLWLLLLAVLLLLLVVGLLAALRPELGPYPAWQQGIVHVVWLLATVCFGLGSFTTIVGAPGAGIFRGVRTPVALLVGFGCVIAFAVGAFTLHLTLALDREADDGRDDHDWDWD